jgi:hypothetical protein
MAPAGRVGLAGVVGGAAMGFDGDGAVLDLGVGNEGSVGPVPGVATDGAAARNQHRTSQQGRKHQRTTRQAPPCILG